MILKNILILELLIHCLGWLRMCFSSSVCMVPIFSQHPQPLYWFNHCHPSDDTVYWLDKIFVSIMVKPKYDFDLTTFSTEDWRVTFVRLLEFGVNEHTNKGIVRVLCRYKYMLFQYLFLLRHVCNNTVLFFVCFLF